MKIETNGKTYTAKRDTHGWSLDSPKEGVHPKTREKTSGVRTTYHATAGQVLAAVADREMGEAEDIKSLRLMVDALRADLLANTLL